MRKHQGVVHRLHVLHFHKQRLGAPVLLHPWQCVIFSFPEYSHSHVCAGNSMGHLSMCLLEHLYVLESLIHLKSWDVALLHCTSSWCILDNRLLSDVQCADIFFYSVTFFTSWLESFYAEKILIWRKLIYSFYCCLYFGFRSEKP